jgi:uncharacterized protein
MRAVDLTTGGELARTLAVATTLFSRARGLLGRRELPAGEGLLIRPCRGVHTFLMKFPIDLVFLDRDNRIVATVENLRPQRLTKLLPRARAVLELPAGTIAASGSVAGNRVEIS